MKHISTLLFLFSSVFVSAQIKYETAMATTASDAIWTVIQDDDDNYLYTGWTNSNWNDILVAKTDAAGGLIWSKTYYSGNGEITEDIATTENGYILGGSYINASTNDYDFLLTRIDTAGNLLWSKRYYTVTGVMENGLSVIQTSDGGFLLGGLYQFSTSSTIYPLMLKTDSLGNLEWFHYLFAGTGAQLGEVIEIPGKKYIGVGAMYMGGSNEIDVFCMDSLGSTLWHRTYGGTGYEYASNISYDTTDNSMVIGGSSSTYGQGSYDYVIFKADSSGNVVWSSHIGNAYDDVITDLEKTWDGGYVFSGNAQFSNGGADDMAIGKVDSLGNFQWMKTKGHPTLSDNARNVVQSSDNGYLVTGNYNTSEIFNAKFDYLGNTCSSWTNRTPVVTHTPLTFASYASASALPLNTVVPHTMSAQSTLTVTPSCTSCQNFSVTATSNSPACIGGNLNLSSSGAVNTTWQGPSFTSTSASPVITNVTAANAGTYYLYADNGAGCNAVVVLEVLVDNCMEVEQQNASAENSGSVYPNPSDGIFTFSFNAVDAVDKSIEITDASGRLIYSKRDWAEGNLTVDLSACERGLYFVRMDMDGVIYWAKVVRK